MFRDRIASTYSAEGYAIAIHGGGVWQSLRRGCDETYTAAILGSLKNGAAMLRQGRSAIGVTLDLALQLEDNPLFKAGRGAVGEAGKLANLDAAIMDGASRVFGAVSNLRNVKNPVLLADHIRTSRSENYISGPGAEDVARKAGLAFCDDDYFVVLPRAAPDLFDTIGVAVRDLTGNLACASSTGGFAGHSVSDFRIGDVPIIGGGTLADNRSCAISTTGRGEKLTETGVTRRVAGRVEFARLTAEAALNQTIDEELRDGSGLVGGLIVLDHVGNVALRATPQFNMVCGFVTDRAEAYAGFLCGSQDLP